MILLSGVDGPTSYHTYAAEVAELGYYAILLDGNSVNDFRDLRRVIGRAQSSAKALPGKAALIGFSLGGGHALTYAAGMPNLVSAIVAYYPKTNHIMNMRSFVADFNVPILVLAGESTYAGHVYGHREWKRAAKAVLDGVNSIEQVLLKKQG